MTRATLLHILDHPAAISPEEVRELEQLAQTFPYCQTAHVLLAKAAHDQGTMLAGQRLRRAATYAADRELLRRLIEQVPEVPEPVADEATVSPPAENTLLVQNEVIPEPAMVVVPEPIAPTVQEQVAAPVEALVVEPTPPSVPEVVAPVDLPEPEPVVEAEPAPLPVAEVIEELPAPVEAETVATEALVAPEAAVPDAESLPSTPAVEAVNETAELPAAAPPIRPTEQGAARFEFGLSEPSPLPVVPYVLPGLEDEAYLPLPELIPAVLRSPAPARNEPQFTPLAFTGDEAVGYGLAVGSRYGFALELLAEHTAAAEASWSVQATPLPPTGMFFEPDVLIAEYWATHRPAPEPVPSSLDLINNFLRRQPRLTRPAAPSPMTEAQVQADLSVRSTDPKPDLASESLARILARQGKNERAIEIYQRLMVKQPEKMAYFAAQIQSLQPPA